MTKSINSKEFYRLVAKEAGSNSPDMARRYCEAMVNILSDELRLTGKCTVMNFGTFRTKMVGGYDKSIPTPHGNTVKYIEPREGIKFTPSDKFKDAVNGKGVSNSYKKRKQSGKLTRKDRELLDLLGKEAEKNVPIIIRKIAETKK